MIRRVDSLMRALARVTVCAALVASALVGGAVAMERLEFRTPGAGDDLRGALRGSSLLLTARRDGVQDTQEIFATARAEYERLLSTLYGAGRYSGTVSIRIDGREAAEIPPLAAPEKIDEIVVTVEPGPLFRFGRARVAPLANGTALPDTFRSGAPARSGILRDAATAAVDGWRAQGHAKAAPDGQTVTADHRRERLDADIAIAPGPRLRFGELVVTGNESVRTERIRQIAGFPTGEIFDPEEVSTAARRLRRAGAFRSASLTEAERPAPDGTLDITAAVVEAPPRRFGFGAEVDTNEGLRLSSFWMHRNLLGGAERLRVEGEIGSVGAQSGGMDYRFSARLSRPATITPDTSVFVEGSAEFVDERDYTADRARIQVGAAHVFSDRLSADAALSLNYERLNDDLGRRDLVTLSLPVGVVRDARDSTLNPTSGTYLGAGLEPFIGFSGAGSGAQLTFDTRAYRGFGADDGVVLAGRFQGGVVVGPDIADTPRSLLFYSGGGGTVRGQPYESLGVRIPDADATDGVLRSGGRGFLGVSGEVRTHITGNFGAVAFADAGYISRGALSGDGDWHAGAGLGLRYDTGIGPIRLDVAAPVRGSTGDGVQIYIGLGQSF